MALVFMDGFDKYGGANTNATSVTALMAGEWTTITNVNIVAPLSATGQAITATAAMTAAKTIATVGRIIGGVRFSSTLVNAGGIQFNDGASNQAAIQIAQSTGIINLRNGSYTVGTIIASSSSSVAANVTHYLEWDLSFGNSAAYAIYLDGVSVISGTGDTTATANNTISSVQLVASNVGVTFDDFYIFDTTGSTNNAALLASPRIETTFPTSDSAVQFGFGAGILGTSVPRVTTATATTANSLYLRRFIPAVSATINSVGIIPAATNGTANYRGVIYADSAGAAGALMSTGSTVTGTTASTAMTLPLTTPQSLTGGTPYWLGFMNDTVLAHQQQDGALTGYRAASTFGSGAPGTAPAMTSGQATYLIWGNLTGITGNNWYEASQQPPPGAPSYVFDATVGHEDLYNFPPLSVPPTNIYAVAVKGFVQKSDSGTKTISFRIKSGATDSGGSATGQALATSFSWLGSFFPTDPNTSAAWTGAALNAATSGVRVDS